MFLHNSIVILIFLQLVLLYDESWDISDMILKLTVDTRKAFVSYFLPLDKEIGKRIKTSMNFNCIVEF